MNTIRKNFLYNVLYNVLTLILPLITTPYISRVMGANSIGIYSYSYSIVCYFGYFILLGLNNYGNRTIAAIRNDKFKMSKTFWSIYGMQIMMSGIVILIYIFYIVFITQEKIMASIQILYLLSVALDINWFFYGMEQFKLTVTRNSIIKLINLLLVFLFVKDKADLYVYGIIMMGGMVVSQLVLWCFLKRYIVFVRIQINDVKKHIKPNLSLFMPVLAISLYTTMSKIILGALSTMEAVGYYEISNRLTQIPTMVVSSLGIVMLPRMSNLFSRNLQKEAMKYIQKSLIISIFLSCSMAFGLSAISKEFVPIFYGEGYEDCIDIISILVLSSIFISWANVIRTQYLIPNKQDKIYITSVTMGAIINIIMNLILIPQYKALGAAIATFITEFTVCAYQTFQVRNEISVSKYLFYTIPFILNGVVMYYIVVKIPTIGSVFITLIIKMVIGSIVYLALSSLYYLIYLKLKKVD